MDELIERIAALMSEGICEPSAYVKSAHLSATRPAWEDDGTDCRLVFYVYTTRPDTDREVVKVVLSRG